MRTARVFGLGSRMSETQRILSGTGAQQTQNRWMAQTVAVVRNHEGGTGLRVEPQARNQRVEPLVGRGCTAGCRMQGDSRGRIPGQADDFGRPGYPWSP
jgi:hypothetical protein